MLDPIPSISTESPFEIKVFTNLRFVLRRRPLFFIMRGTLFKTNINESGCRMSLDESSFVSI